MDKYSKDDLLKAQVVITSLISKCEKAKENLTKGHLTLIENRINALRISVSLIEKSLEKPHSLKVK